ncbi:MAG: hypothetical protein JJT94_10510 [Bernardetiaceae bacterium]|nr:hypothetical protein [Bernardetiaceae bacterium]
MKKNMLIPTMLLLILMVQACKQDTRSLINPPFPSLDVPFEIFEFDVAEGGTFVLPTTGTRIHVPTNAFKNADGKTINGTVALHFREMEKQLDLFRTGITMSYDTAGRNENFTSAGMFELRAFKEKEALELSKPIEVELASDEGDTDYSFYQLDEEQGWQYINTSAPDSNRYKIKSLDSLDKALENTSAFGKEFFAFNYDVLIDAYFKQNTKKILRNKKNQTIRRRIEKYGIYQLRNPYITGIDIRQSMNKKGSPDPLLFWLWKFDEPTNIPSWLSNPKAKVEIKALSTWQYLLTATYNNRTWKRNIYPVMSLREVFKHTPRDWKANNKKYLKQVENSNREFLEQLQVQRKAIERQKDFMRTMKVNDLAVYNYDRLLKQDDYIQIQASFDVGSSQEEELLSVVYFLPDAEKSVISFHQSSFEELFYISPSLPGIYCAVLSDGHLAITDDNYFESLDFSRLRRDKKHRFKLRRTDTPINSIEDLEEVLNLKDKDENATNEEEPIAAL